MTLPPRDALPTHEVTNQPPQRGDGDLLEGDPGFAEAAAVFGADIAVIRDQAAWLGEAVVRAAGREANRRLPELVLFDTGGRRLDEVRFVPEYHRFMARGLAAGYAGGPWTGGSHVTHAALVYLFGQVEPGSCCPMTMTYAAVPALAAAPEIEAVWRPRLTSRDYDPAIAPVWDKRGATLGMAMTEKQGGSDLRANATRAERDGGAWRLTGHKWFCSAPMSDGFLTLAQTEKGLSCFLVPRWLEEGRNAIAIQRLKDKLGNRSNASAEIEYQGARAQLLGREGEGVKTILAMVHHTRLDTAMAPAGLMRAALVEAAWWAGHRRVFQRRLADQPLMAAVLADLALDAEGALAAGLYVAAAFDAPGEEAKAFSRLAVALAKFLSNKLCGPVVGEAMEVLGGMGYVEDTALPMLWREAPLNGIWEGSGNVIALDIQRTLAREPLAGETFRAELARFSGRHPAYDAALAALPAGAPEAAARLWAEDAALLLTAAALFQTAPDEVAEAYAASRLAGRRRIYGTAEGLPVERLVQRLGA